MSFNGHGYDKTRFASLKAWTSLDTKGNDNHDERGRFASGDAGGAQVSSGRAAQHYEMRNAKDVSKIAMDVLNNALEPEDVAAKYKNRTGKKMTSAQMRKIYKEMDRIESNSDNFGSDMSYGD